MVFYHHSYGSMSDAVQHPDGLAVLACMFSVSCKCRISCCEVANYFSEREHDLVRLLPLNQQSKQIIYTAFSGRSVILHSYLYCCNI